MTALDRFFNKEKWHSQVIWIFITFREYRLLPEKQKPLQCSFMHTFEPGLATLGRHASLPPASLFCVAKRKKGDKGKKGRVSKQKLLKGCHQGQNIIVLAILQRLEFENFPCRSTMVADNSFQCSTAPLLCPLWNPFCRPWKKRLFYHYRCKDMVSLFVWNPIELCFIFRLDFIHQRHQRRLESWNLYFLQPPYIQRYADAVDGGGAPADWCFDFVHGKFACMFSMKGWYKATTEGHMV